MLKNTLHDGCFRPGGRGGARLTRDWLAKWPDLATLMLIDVWLVATVALFPTSFASRRCPPPLPPAPHAGFDPAAVRLTVRFCARVCGFAVAGYKEMEELARLSWASRGHRDRTKNNMLMRRRSNTGCTSTWAAQTRLLLNHQACADRPDWWSPTSSS